MKKKKFFLIISLALVIAFVFVEKLKAEKFHLLTENGLSNPKYSEYKNKPIIKTGGFYYVVPETAEKGAVDSPIPFSKGILVDGDSTFANKRKPSPYIYWFHQSPGILIFDLKKSYFVSQVRIKLLVKGKSHGTEKIFLSTWKEMHEAKFKLGNMDVYKLGVDSSMYAKPFAELKARNKWNEFTVNKITDKIILKFTAMKGNPRITISEVEIWGKEANNSVLVKKIAKIRKAEQKLRKKENKIRSKVATMQNLAFSGRGATCWSTFECPNSIYHSKNVLTQKDGSLKKDALWAQGGNYWDCRKDIPQVLVVKLPRIEQVSLIRLIWFNTSKRCSEYLLEYKDGDVWKMLFNETNNLNQVATYRFTTLKTDAFRLTAYKFKGRNYNRMLMRSFQVYDVDDTESNKRSKL